MDDYLTTPEVAKHYRTSEATVRYWRHIGYGPRGIKVGRRVLYALSEVARFDAERRAGDGVPAA
ncbi:MAG: helix-turn-helix transcriptional regulator [Nocardioidaceae bacterium]